MPIFVSAPLINTMDIDFAQNNLILTTNVENNRVCVFPLNNVDWKKDYKIWDNVQSVALDSYPLEFFLTITAPGYIPLTKRIKNVQNISLTDDEDIIADVVRVGSNICEAEPYGEVVFKSGTHTIQGSNVFFKPGTQIKQGAEVKIGMK